MTDYFEKADALKLKPEILPNSLHRLNYRNLVGQEKWDLVRKKAYKNSNHKCFICGETGLTQGYQHPVECHEEWEFDNENKIAYITDFKALCPLCHANKHFILHFDVLKKNVDKIIRHFMKVNEIENHNDTMFLYGVFRGDFCKIQDICYDFELKVNIDDFLNPPQKIKHRSDYFSTSLLLGNGRSYNWADNCHEECPHHWPIGGCRGECSEGMAEGYYRSVEAAGSN